MKTIRFTDKELELLRQQYQAELEQTEQYLEDLKLLIGKLGKPSPPDPGLILGKTRKTRSDKGKKRKRTAAQAGEPEKKSPGIKEEKAPSKVAGKPKKQVVPKKKARKRPRRVKGVFLTPLRKPLVLKEKPEEKPEQEKKSGTGATAAEDIKQ